MKDNLLERLDEFISSNEKYCLVVGDEYHRKHISIIKYLNSIGKKLRVLIRISTMSESEEILGFKAKTGVPRKIGNLTIFVDSMQLKSQVNTPRDFSCVIIYPIGALKGIEDCNIDNIVNDLNVKKVFWVSCYPTKNVAYVKEVCEVEKVIEVNEEIGIGVKNEEEMSIDDLDYLEIKNLSYYAVEEALSVKYKMGYIHSSSMGSELVVGGFGKYTFCGASKTKTFAIKVKSKKTDGNYVLIVKECIK